MRRGLQFEQIDKWFKLAPLVTNRLHSQKAIFALLNLEQYINGLILQWNRMMSDHLTSHSLLSLLTSTAPTLRISYTEEARRWEKQVSDEHSKARDITSLDVHFYLICWDKVNNRFKQLVKLEPRPKVGMAQRKVKTLLEQATKARNFLEHPEEKNLQGHGIGMSGDDDLEFSYTDTDKKTKRNLPERKVKLGKNEIKMVMRAYEEVVSALKEVDPRPLDALDGGGEEARGFLVIAGDE